MAFSKEARREKIRRRIRPNVLGSSQRPRLSVYRSNSAIYAQVVDDVQGVTLAATSSRDKVLSKENGNKCDIAKLVGKKIGELAKSAGIEEVAFDRGGYLYHGRIKSLAEGAREAGLKF